jgi:flagellar biosynthetic protein FliQ
MTALTFIPAVVLMMTGFTRIVIVLSLLRHAMGTRAPNQVIVGLALFLTFFVMSPVLDRVYTEAYLPLSENRINVMQAAERAAIPMRGFMLKQTRESDLALFAGIAKIDKIDKPEDTPLRILVPAFVISELKTAFQIGFHPVHSLPGHRHGGRQPADVDGHDDDVAGDGRPALQADAVRSGRRLASGHRLAGPELHAMTPGIVMEIGRQAIEVTLLIAAPMLVTALVVGLIISIFQAATQLNESTLQFVPKLVAMFVVLLLAGPWMLQYLIDYIQRLFGSIPQLIG